MSQIIEIAMEASGKLWRVQAVVDVTESAFVWFDHNPSQQDVDDAIARHVSQAAQDRTDHEISANVSNVLALGSFAAYTLDHSTAAQNFTALREAYRTATQTQAIMTGDFLNSLTSNQLQNAFGMTAGQVTTLRANKLTPAASAAATIRSTTGV